VNHLLQCKVLLLKKINASGCPNHYNTCDIGSGLCSSYENETQATVQNHSYLIYAYPCFANATINVSCQINVLGILRNGVVIYGPALAVNDCGDAVANAGRTFDYCGGHSDGSGIYHYHVPPSCLLDQLNITSNKSHSPLLGFMLDGFPIYGPYGQNQNKMYACTNTTYANQSDCLDECNGHSQHTVDGYKYHYHISGDTTDLSTLPASPLPGKSFYPYTVGCFKGLLKLYSYITTTNKYSCNGTGYTDSFTPQLFEGFTDPYGSNSNTNTSSPQVSPTQKPTISNPTTSNNTNSTNNSNDVVPFAINIFLFNFVLILTVGMFL